MVVQKITIPFLPCWLVFANERKKSHENMMHGWKRGGADRKKIMGGRA